MGKIKTHVISIAISLGVGFTSAYITRGGMGIYSEVNVPPLAPPSFLFPIVWTILFILMGISAAMVYNNTSVPSEQKKRALKTYAISLILNFTWSIIFFNFRAFSLAFVWLILLLIFIIKTILQYKKISPLAAYLQIPYLIWVTFAGYLTLGIAVLNS